MRRAMAVLLVLLPVMAGCGGAPHTDIVVLDPEAAAKPPKQLPPSAEPPEAQNTLWNELAGDEPPGTRFVPGDEAEECPRIRVTDGTGMKLTLQPRQRGYAEPGYVTMLVFWKPERTSGRAAARYVSDCVEELADNRVRGIGFVEAPPIKMVVDDTKKFRDLQGLVLEPIYYDDWSALEELLDAIDGVGEEPSAAIFIIDRRMRVRFYRGAFLFGMGQWDSDEPGGEDIEESAPDGKKIRDYLIRILQEGP